MKKCPNCGHKLKKKDKFCSSCGKKLIKPTKKKKIQKVKPVEKEKKRLNKAIYGYLVMIFFFLFPMSNIILSDRLTDIPTLLENFLAIGGSICYFAWFVLSLYLLKDRETRIHGIILFVFWLVFGMKSIAYQTTPWYERIFK